MNVKLEERNAEPSAPTSEAERDRELLVAKNWIDGDQGSCTRP